MCWLWFLCGWHKRQTCPLRNCSTPCDLPIHLSTLLSPSASSAVDMWSCSMPAAKRSLDGSESGFCRQQSFPVFASTDGLASLSRCSPVKKLGFVFQLHICKLLWDTTGLYFFVSRSGMPGWRKCLVFCLRRMQDRGKARGDYGSKGEMIIEGMPMGRGWVQCSFSCSLILLKLQDPSQNLWLFL